MRQLILALFLFSVPCFAQVFSSGGPVVDAQGSPYPQGAVAVCTSQPNSSTPCGGSSLATTYTTVALGTQCTNNALILGPLSGTGCTNPGKTDQHGNFSIFAQTNTLFYAQMYGSLVVTSSYPFQTGSGGVGEIPRPHLNAVQDCGLQGFPHDDTTALQNCISNSAHLGDAIDFPVLVNAPNELTGNPSVALACSYLFSGTITFPKAGGVSMLFGESTTFNQGATLCWTTDVQGIQVNQQDTEIKGLMIANVSGNYWDRANVATYGVPTNHFGIQVCAPNFVLSTATLYYWTGDAVNMDSRLCLGGSTDYSSANVWTLDHVVMQQNKGYGLFAAGFDANVGSFKDGYCKANQLGCFADNAEYGNHYININGDSNGSDPSAATGIKNITSCTTTEGAVTCTIPSHGFISNDSIIIAGNSDTHLNTVWRYVQVTDANTITFQCGCESGPVTGTGGTAGYQPGVRIWATNNLFAGSLWTNNPVGPALLEHVYMEGTNGPAAAAFASLVDPQGALSSLGFYYLLNTSTSFARLGTINTQGNGQPLLMGFDNNWNFVQFNTINPLSGWHAYSLLVAGASATATGLTGRPDDDCVLGAIDTSPYISTQTGRLSLCRWPHIKTTTNPYNSGYWTFRSQANQGSTLYDAFGFTDHQSPEQDGYAVLPNAMLLKNGFIPTGFAGEGTLWGDANFKLRFFSGTTEASPTYSSTTPTLNGAACIKAVGPPVQIGSCANAFSGTPPTCTCN